LEETKDKNTVIKNIIIEFNNKKLIINIEEESLEEIKELNNFILDEIGKNGELNFTHTDNNNENFTIKKIIDSIIEIYNKEYKEIKDFINETTCSESSE